MRPWQRFALQALVCNYNGKLSMQADGIHLQCDMVEPITPNYVKELEEALDEWWHERAAIKEFDGNMSREQAEAQAFEELKEEIVK